MNDDLRNMARAVVEKVQREVPGAKFRPGTIVDPNTGHGIATVRLFGDPPDTSVEVTNALGIPVGAGDGVIIVFDPPQGAYILGKQGGLAVVPSGRIYIDPGGIA